MSPSLDLNADLGESFGVWRLGDDAALLRVVTSANIACGFHAGDAATLVRTCAQAAAHDVRVGAQVSYRDLAGFGRRFIDVDPDDLFADVLYQIGALDGIARAHGTRVSYVKPHGALYNATVEHEQQAQAVVRAVEAYDAELPVLGLPGSRLLAEAEDSGLRPVREFFADRGYTPEGTLVPRRLTGAMVTDHGQVSERVVRMATEGTVVAVDGSVVPVTADSVCVHGDSPEALRTARAVRDALAEHDIELKGFV